MHDFNVSCVVLTTTDFEQLKWDYINVYICSFETLTYFCNIFLNQYHVTLSYPHPQWILNRFRNNDIVDPSH